MDKFFGLDNPAQQDEGIELLTTVRSAIDQAIVESKLREAEIPYLMKERGGGSVMKIMLGYSIYGTDIYVKTEDIDRAAELLIPELDASEDGENEDDSPTEYEHDEYCNDDEEETTETESDESEDNKEGKDK